MSRVLRERYTVDLPVRRRREIRAADGTVTGFTTEPAGTERVTVEIQVNVEDIARDLAYRARHSSRGKATAMSQDVIVRWVK